MKIGYYYNFSARSYPDYSKTLFNSMVIIDGYIINAGFDIKKPSEDTPCYNLNGAIVFPPFVDSHIHFMQTGIVESGCQLDEAFCLKDIFNIISDEARGGEYILGWNLDYNQIKEKRYPTLKELDKISNKKFIWLVSKDLHCCVANSVALKWAKEEYPNLIHNEGLISGESYNFLCYKINDLLPESYKIDGLKLAEKKCIEKGIATVHCLEGTQDNPYETLLVDKFFQNSQLESYIYNQSSDPSIPLEKKWGQMGGCILVDGSIASRTAALFENYADEDTTGDLYLDSDAIMEIAKTASLNNLQLALHAIGDFASELVASSYMWAIETFGEKERPNRIEHFIIPSLKAIKNAKKANAIIGIQPAYDYFWGGSDNVYAQRLGEERASYCNPFRTLEDSGLTLIGGSDSPVTPIDPLLGVQAIVNHTNPEERLDLNKALAIFINEPHRATNNFERRGHLRIGERADFICLNRDPFLIASTNIKDIVVEAIFIKGEPISRN